MKRIFLISMLLTGVLTVGMQAQTLDKDLSKAEKKAKKEAHKLQEKIENVILFKEAEKALNDQAFVLEGDQIIFKRGRSAFVNPSTNFVSLADGRATVQVAFSSNMYAGPNGIGGVTVDGMVSNVKQTKDKRGNINFSMNISGVDVSAQVNIQLANGSNAATVTIYPNFNSNRMTLSGKLLPINKSSVYKGRAY